jgi:hypothetical protein
MADEVLKIHDNFMKSSAVVKKKKGHLAALTTRFNQLILVKQNPPCAASLASTCGWRTKSALKVSRIRVSLCHKVATAFRALGHGQHIVVHEFDQAPSAGN